MRVCGRNILQRIKTSFWRTTPNCLKIPQIPPFLGILFTLLLKSGAGFHAIASGSHYFGPPWLQKRLSWDIGPEVFLICEPWVNRGRVIHQTCKVPDVALSPPGVDQRLQRDMWEGFWPRAWQEKDFWVTNSPLGNQKFSNRLYGWTITKDEKSKRKWILRPWKPDGNSCLPEPRGTGPAGAKVAALRWEQTAYCIMKAIDPSVCLPSQAEPITSGLSNNHSLTLTNTIEDLKKAFNKNAALL